MTGERFFVITPTDTLFFRDGRPYNQDDEGLAHARSLFPPYASTLTGALRAALALDRGWSGKGDWDSGLKAVLGDGPDMEGAAMRWGAPVLLRKGEVLYPAPRALVGDDTVGYGLLRPGPARACDLGSAVRLPVDPGAPPGQPRRAVKELWLTRKGLDLVLNDRVGELSPSDTVRSADLWAFEHRVGLELDASSRTAVHGRLYAPVHVRLEADVALGLPAFGLERGWAPVAVVPLGGEQRTAMVEEVATPPAPPPRAVAFRTAGASGRLCVMLTLLSPARVDETWLRPGPVAGWNAEIVAACLDDPVRIGGWDSRAGTPGPRPLRAFLPAGSAWFLHVPPGWTEPHDFVGMERDARHGFGRFALGTFDDRSGISGADSQGDAL